MIWKLTSEIVDMPMLTEKYTVDGRGGDQEVRLAARSIMKAEDCPCCHRRYTLMAWHMADEGGRK